MNGIYMYMDNENPIISYPDNFIYTPFWQTTESIKDYDEFERFIKNAVSRFRASSDYREYKSKLLNNGMDRCQIFGNIDNDAASIEMHHNILTIHDIAKLIAFHIINTRGKINSFELIQLLIWVHNEHLVPISMLSETAHEFYHNNNGYMPPNMVYGKWWELLSKFRYGIDITIGRKIISYLNNYELELDHNINIFLRDNLLQLSNLNDYYFGGIYGRV